MIPQGVGAPPPPGLDPKKGKLMCIKVRLLDDSIAVFHLGDKAIGQSLFDEVCRHLNLVECDYFGLEFFDCYGNHCWLDLEKSILRQITTSRSDARFHFIVKFYTPNPSDLEEEYTRYLLTLQLKRDLQTGELAVSISTASLLASFLVQSDCGDYCIQDYPDHKYLSAVRFVPDQDDRFQRKLMDNHKRLIGTSPAESDLALLETARRCDFYGVKFHLARQYYKDTIEFLFETRNECKTFWKKCIEHHAFFRCTDMEQTKRQSREGKLFSKGSSFRYNGRTQMQLIDYVREHHKRREPFTRPIHHSFAGRRRRPDTLLADIINSLDDALVPVLSSSSKLPITNGHSNRAVVHNRQPQPTASHSQPTTPKQLANFYVPIVGDNLMSTSLPADRLTVAETCASSVQDPKCRCIPVGEQFLSDDNVSQDSYHVAEYENVGGSKRNDQSPQEIADSVETEKNSTVHNDGEFVPNVKTSAYGESKVPHNEGKNASNKAEYVSKQREVSFPTVPPDEQYDNFPTPNPSIVPFCTPVYSIKKKQCNSFRSPTVLDPVTQTSQSSKVVTYGATQPYMGKIIPNNLIVANSSKTLNEKPKVPPKPRCLEGKSAADDNRQLLQIDDKTHGLLQGPLVKIESEDRPDLQQYHLFNSDIPYVLTMRQVQKTTDMDINENNECKSVTKQTPQLPAKKSLDLVDRRRLPSPSSFSSQDHSVSSTTPGSGNVLEYLLRRRSESQERAMIVKQERRKTQPISFGPTLNTGRNASSQPNLQEAKRSKEVGKCELKLGNKSSLEQFDTRFIDDSTSSSNEGRDSSKIDIVHEAGCDLTRMDTVHSEGCVSGKVDSVHYDSTKVSIAGDEKMASSIKGLALSSRTTTGVLWTDF